MKREGGRHILIIFGLLSAILVLITAMFFTMPGFAQQDSEVILYSQDFESGYPDQWELEKGWEVVEVEGGHALSGQGHSWASVNAGPWEDSRFKFGVKLENTAGLHANIRLREASRYFIGISQDSIYLSKQTGQGEFFENLGTASGIGSGWHTIEIAAYGPVITVSVDSDQRISHTDPDPIMIGGIAFESLKESPILIDDVEVWGEEPVQFNGVDPGLSWVRTGGPLGGLGYDIRMRPDNPDILYVTDAFAGVFMSTDGGQTWLPSNDGITVRTGESGDSIPIFCLTIDPLNHDIIWAGAQFNRGIFKSTDGGKNWVKMDNGVVEEHGITFRGFTIDPRSSDVVYAAGEVSSWIWYGEPRNGREFDMTQGVVYKTTNSGQSWEVVWRGDNLARYVWIDPRNPEVLYVSTGIFDREAANSNPESRMPGGVGVIKSRDGGKTWVEINHGLENLYVGSLFMHPDDSDILLAGAGNNQYFNRSGVYLSTDGGANWTQTLEGENIQSVEISVANPEIAYAGSEASVYRSEDGGESWQRVTGGVEGWGPPGVRAGFPIDFEVDTRSPDRIFTNNYGGGNFLSTDGGRTWMVASQGYTGAQVRAIAVDPNAPGRVVVAARSGLFASDDGGATWNGLGYGPASLLEWNAVAIDPDDSKHILAGSNWDGQMVNSYDGGSLWVTAGERVREGVGWKVIAFAPSDPSTVYAGTAGFCSAGSFDHRISAAGFFVSHNNGQTWQEANDSDSQNAAVYDLAIDPTDPKIVYAVTHNYGVLKTTDGGDSWTAINDGLPGDAQAAAIVLYPTDPDMILVGRWRGGIFRSTDAGQSWDQSSNGLNPEANITDIIYDPTNLQVVYTTDIQSGVYRSEDNGNTWGLLSNGLRNRAVNALSISMDGQHLYAATEGEGVYRLDLSGEPPEVAKAIPLETEITPSTDQEPQPAKIEPPEDEFTGDQRQETAPKSGICSGLFAPVGLVLMVYFAQRMK